jgi:hypothetical protein
MRAQLAEVVRLATAEAIDRLKLGDVVLDAKSGERVRVPLKGKDAMVIGGIAFDKLRIAEGRSTKITETVDLAALADRFRAIARGEPVLVAGTDPQRDA